MKFAVLLLLAGLATAQEPPSNDVGEPATKRLASGPPPAAPANPAPGKSETMADLKKQLTEKDNEINWLNEVIKQLNTKMDAMMKFYGANDTLQQLEKFKPVPVPEKK